MTLFKRNSAKSLENNSFYGSSRELRLSEDRFLFHNSSESISSFVIEMEDGGGSVESNSSSSTSSISTDSGGSSSQGHDKHILGKHLIATTMKMSWLCMFRLVLLLLIPIGMMRLLSAFLFVQNSLLSLALQPWDAAVDGNLILLSARETRKLALPTRDTLNGSAQNGSNRPSSGASSSSSKFRFNYTEIIQHAIFFNIYIPEAPDGQENALRIVQEQIGQIKNSYAWRAVTSKASMVVYYVTLGKDQVLTPELMSRFCGSQLRCIHVDHFTEATEVVTLQHTYQFCSSPGNLKSRITYLHNKGSFHYNEVNENWRPILTDAALSEMCIQEASDCNLCGLQFYTQWAPFIPGNMFTAKCDYVQKLLPPIQFASAMEKAIREFVMLRLKKQVLTQLLPDRKDFFGLERYSDEHWIASHPDVIPCDCDPTGHMWIYHTEKTTLANLSWAMAPRHEGAPAYNKRARTDKINKSRVLRVVEYYYLAGNLIKWFSLYGKGPEPNSWAYKFFPDGDMWKDAVQKYGAKAVDEVTQEYASDIVFPEDPPFPEEPLERKLATKVQVLDKASFASNASAAVFFDIGVHADVAEETAVSEIQFVREQFDIISSSKSISNVYYLTMGHDLTTKMNLCDQTRGLHCEHLKHTKDLYAGETIRHIHEYCQRNAHQKVVYLRNQLPSRIKDPKRRQRLMKHLTMAVTSDVCLRSLDNRNQCNLCGLQFFTIHTPHMLGNMWASSCSHINQLLPPEEFVDKLRDYSATVLIQKIWTRINFGLLDETPDRLGLGGHALEHWVGSHPELLPCDLTDQPVSFWIQKSRKSRNFRLYKGPHTKEAPYVSINPDKEAQVMTTERLRMREFHYLPGNLLKWFLLYDKVPPAFSWAWAFFPDGKLWKDSVEKYGKAAVQEITSQYELSEVEIHAQWAEQEAAEAEAIHAANRAAHAARLAEAAARHAAQIEAAAKAAAARKAAARKAGANFAEGRQAATRETADKRDEVIQRAAREPAANAIAAMQAAAHAGKSSELSLQKEAAALTGAVESSKAAPKATSQTGRRLQARR